MRKSVRTIFGKPVSHDGYGPKGKAAIYKAKGKNGVTYEVSRHQWSLPTSHWAWKAEPVAAADGTPLDRYGRKTPLPKGVKTVYGDTLEDLANRLGYDWEEIEPGSTL